MIRRTHRQVSAARDFALATLEPRALLGGSNNVIDFDLDTFSVTLNGPGTASVTMGANGVALLQVSGSNSTTDVVISRTGAAGDGLLRIHRLVVNGDIDELRTDQFVNFENVFLELAQPGVSITGRARVIDIAGSVINSDITIAATGNNNRTNIYIFRALGNLFTANAAPVADLVQITSGGIVERLEIDAASFVGATARRFNVIDMVSDLLSTASRGPGGGMTFAVNATEANAPYGIKTIEVDGSIEDGTIFSNSPVEKIIVDDTGFISDLTGRGATARGFSDGELDVSVNGRLGSFKARTGDIFGTLKATSFGAIDVRDNLDVDLRGFVAIPPLEVVQAQSIDSLRAGQLVDSLLEVNGIANDGSGFIKTLAVGEIDGCTITTGWIGTCTVTGSAIEDGQVLGSTITLNNTTRARALDAMTVAGDFNNSHLNVIDNNVGSITLNGGILFSDILVGVINPGALFSGNPFNASNRVIASVKVKAPLGDSFGFQSSNIAADTINSLTSNAKLEPFNTRGGPPFGIVADVLSAVSFRLANNSIFNTPNSSTSDSSFRIRII